MELIARIVLFIFVGAWTSRMVNMLIKHYKLENYYLVGWYVFMVFELLVLFAKNMLN